jgi:hypothetical protein
MKIFSGFLSLLCFISTASLSYGANSQHVISSGNLKVPGKSPLLYCKEDHTDDILQIDYFDVDPNPPLAYDCSISHDETQIS